MSFNNGTSTSLFVSCPATCAAATATQFTTGYETVLQAECPTGQWMATYTIEEVCDGPQSLWTPPAIPPGFVVTTVDCPVCPEKSVEITCPGAQPTGEGIPPPPYTINGNGVTADIVATPVPAAPAQGGPAPAATTLATAIAGGAPAGGAPAGGAPAGGAPAGSAPGSAAPGSEAGSAPAAGSAPGEAGSAPAAGSAPGSAGSAPEAGAEAGSDVPAVTANSNGTMPTMPVTAGAPSLKRSAIAISGLALAAAPFFLL